MHSSPQSAVVPVQSPIDAATPAGQREDLVYQVVTVAAIVLLLASLWLF
jgi:hypothetical protein